VGIFANRASSPLDEWARRQLDIPPVIQVEPREISIVLAQHLPLEEFRLRR
jgi:type IV secretion system protein TrbI